MTLVLPMPAPQFPATSYYSLLPAQSDCRPLPSSITIGAFCSRQRIFRLIAVQLHRVLDALGLVQPFQLPLLEHLERPDE